MKVTRHASPHQKKSKKENKTSEVTCHSCSFNPWKHFETPWELHLTLACAKTHACNQVEVSNTKLKTKSREKP
jgi:hypothetical protein